MKYIVQSTAVWDTIFLHGMWKPIEAPGGAGFYAMVGMKVWEDDVGLVTGVGADYLLHFQEWYHNNALSMQGMLLKDPHSPKTIIRYAPDGERTEEPVYGWEHYQKMEAVPEEIEPFCVNADGMYVFKIEQWGVPDLIDTALRKEAERRKESILALLEGKNNE